jgi:hypothetical protein
MDTPASVANLPQDLMVNQQARTANDSLRDLPSVEVRHQQGLEVSRPQLRGFQGSIVENARLVGSTPNAARCAQGAPLPARDNMKHNPRL